MENGKRLPLVEEFHTIQGEGFNAGRAAYFIRLGGCDIGCSWCDTKFAWDPSLHPLVVTDEIIRKALESKASSVVVTGGEPLIYNLDYLCGELKKLDVETCLETSGAFPLSGMWDWICLSPKADLPPLPGICDIADELKVVIRTGDDFPWAEENAGKVSPGCLLYLQPEWSRYEMIIPGIVQYVKQNPRWSISLQVHKFMHIP